MNVSKLWQDNSEFVLKVVRRYVNNSAVAEDIRQEVFLRIVYFKESFKKHSSIKTWLYTITFRCCMDYFRDEKRQQMVLNGSKSAGNLCFYDREYPVWEVNDISQVPCPLSQLFVELHYGEGWSIEDISHIFGYNIDNVRKKIKIGLQHLGNAI
ncbi:MAG: RNA polymerase sigma factor [Fibromonadales bacterium]|nr:RNA polymerase sigma factor [Fibromonadales bacterium]